MTATTGFTAIRTYAWILLLIRALLALGLGIVVLASGQIQSGMVNVIAIYWLLGALLTMRWARAHPGTREQGLAAAAIILARGYLRDLLDEERMLALVGAFSVAIGALRVSGVFRESVSQAVRRSRPEAIVLGILEMGLGFVLIFSVELRPIAVPMVGIWGLVGGSIMLADAIRAYRALRRAPTPRADAASTD